MRMEAPEKRITYKELDGVYLHAYGGTNPCCILP